MGWRRAKCNHLWVILDKTILESPYEQLCQSGQPLKQFDSSWGFQKKLILIARCSLCGVLDKTISCNPD